MKLQIGERLPGSGPPHQPGGYVVTDVVAESPWHGLYAGKKILYNFDFAAKRVRETDEKEWLDVTLRTIHYPYLDDPQYVAQRRALARAELRGVLGGGGSNLWPEPIDLLELPSSRDAFAFAQPAGDLEPIVVMARASGQLLSDWRQKTRPLTHTLAVLAELLTFIEQVHDDGLLLHGMGPASILIDQAQRVHYVGTDMVMNAAADTAPPASWPRIFPAERYPSGFSPPEYFSDNAHAIQPDQRGDLYSWGSLAFFLITGQSPAQIAFDQGRAWAHFEDEHFTALEQALQALDPAQAASWLEQLGVGAAAKSMAWPGAFMDLLRLLLHPDPRRRPGSVAELRRWLIAPPPAMIPALLALRVGPTEARIFLDSAGLDDKLEVTVRRTVGQPPTEPTDGEPILEGPFKPMIQDRQAPAAVQPVYYAACTRRRHGEDITYSPPVITELLEPSRANLQSLADDEVHQFHDHNAVPGRVRLCFRAMDPAVVAEALLASSLSEVRGWALKLLYQLRKAGKASDKVDAVLWSALRDGVSALRLAAARGILAGAAVTDDLVLKLAGTMGAANVDGALQAAQSLLTIGVPQDVVARVVSRLEADRPEACPVCNVKIASGQRLHHLRALHCFVELDGIALPRAEALARLWNKVAVAGDQAAHEQLLSITSEPDAQTRDGTGTREPDAQARDGLGASDHPYVTSLLSALADLAPPYEKIIHCLRQSRTIPKLIPHLLRSHDPRAREIGREALLPHLSKFLRSVECTPHIIRKALEHACPGSDLLAEKILVCYRLPQLGVDEKQTAACLAQLQDETLKSCPECNQSVPARDLEAHLLTVHGICQFRGVRLTQEELKATVLDALCGNNADVPAARMLELLAKGDVVLVTWVCQRLGQVAEAERLSVTVAVAESLCGTKAGPRLLPMLLAADPARQTLAHNLALEIIAHQPGPIDEPMLPKIKPLLADRNVALTCRHNALAGLLRGVGSDGPRAYELLSAFVSQSNKKRALEQLRDLEGRLGKSATLDRLQSETMDQVRMSCPKCGKQLVRKEMGPHLWDEHRLILDGLSVREPWRLLEDWVVDYRVEKDPDLLKRCTDLAGELDGAAGMFRLQQLMLRHGVDDADARAAVLAQAEEQHATVCPRCYHLVPVPALVEVAPLDWEGGEYQGHGYRMTASDRGPIPTMTIEADDEVTYKGREPGRWITRLGVALVGYMPVVLLLFVVMKAIGDTGMSRALMLGLALGCGLVLDGLIYLAWPSPRPKRDRLIDAVWTAVVPDLLDEKLDAAQAGFLGSLAETSRGRGRPAVRAELLTSCLEKTRGPKLLSVQAALVRLQLDDLIRADEDPFPLLMETLNGCLTGKASLGLLDLLLQDLGQDEAWSKARRARLKMLLVEAMFAAGIELRDLPDLAQAYPALGELLDIRNANLLVGLRYLCAVRDAKPWQKFGKAITVFDLAREFAQTEALLNKYPGLLLSVPGLPIFLSIRGLWCKDVCLQDRPRSVEVHKLPGKDGFQLIMGQEHLWFSQSPDDLAEELQGWVNYYFADLIQAIKKCPVQRGGDALKKLLAGNSCSCKYCGNSLLPRVGALGVNTPRDDL